MRSLPKPILVLRRAVAISLCVLCLGAQATEPEDEPALRKLRAGFELGVCVSDLTTGNPYNPHAQGGGFLFALTVGTQFTRHVGLYGVLRTPFYFFEDEMPGLGISLDWFDFNALVVSFTVGKLTAALGPSFDALLPLLGNRAFGGGGDFRLDYELVHHTSDQKARLTLGLVFHPSAMQFTEKHGFFGYLKVVWIGGVTLGAQWQ